MKVAVLISGELRTFEYTRSSMSFLDDPQVDVYVSTWSTTRYEIPKLDIDITVEHNQEEISRILDRPATIDIRPTIPFDYERYNSRMIDRWLAGYQLILDSGIAYDYVIITRPDIRYFEHIDLDKLHRYDGCLATVWGNTLPFKKLADTVLVAQSSIMHKILSELTVSAWATTDADWHEWWYNWCTSRVEITIAPDFDQCVFWRPLVNKSLKDRPHLKRSYLKVPLDDWRDLRLLNTCDIIGVERAAQPWAWEPEVVANALKKWESGYFERYRQWRP